MKKEVLFAIFFGILLGLTVAVVMVWRIRSGNSSDKQIQSETPPPPVRKDVKVVENSLELTQPSNGFITKSSTVAIKGKVEKGSTVIVQSPLTEKILKSTSDTFQITFPLAIGENIIMVAAYPADKTVRPQQKTISVYYLDEQ